MKVRFSNGIIKNCNAPTEQKIINRIDWKTFGVGWSVILRLTGEMTSDELDNIFTEDNCENIILIQDDEEKTETLLYGYVLKTDLNKKIVEIAPESPEEEAIFEPRINITLARRSYAETKMAALSLAIDMLCMEDADNV